MVWPRTPGTAETGRQPALRRSGLRRARSGHPNRDDCSARLSIRPQNSAWAKAFPIEGVRSGSPPKIPYLTGLRRRLIYYNRDPCHAISRRSVGCDQITAAPIQSADPPSFSLGRPQCIAPLARTPHGAPVCPHGVFPQLGELDEATLFGAVPDAPKNSIGPHRGHPELDDLRARRRRYQ